MTTLGKAGSNVLMATKRMVVVVGGCCWARVEGVDGKVE